MKHPTRKALRGVDIIVETEIDEGFAGGRRDEPHEGRQKVARQPPFADVFPG